MTKSKSVMALAGGLCAGFFFAIAGTSAVAGPVPSAVQSLGMQSEAAVTTVAAKRKVRRDRWSGQRWAGQRWYDRDTVGSLGYDGRGYAFNKFSGQVYYSCMLDLGYGRVRPCDAGSR